MSAMDLPLLARGLGRTFRAAPWSPRVIALAALDLEVGPGDVVGLVGPNGSGKTTALRCSLGLLRPTHGTARVFGRDPRHAEARRRIGFAPERFDLSGRRSGRETLRLLATLSGLRGAERERRVAAALGRLDLEAAASRRLSRWSKGMVRRLAIAAALLAEPGLLVLDEPFDGLDPLGNVTVRGEIARRAAEGAGVLVTSHALADLEAVATHLVVLDRGRVLASGRLDDVLARRGAVALEVEGLAADDLRAVEESVRARGGTVRAARPARETLEEFFQRRIGGGGG